MSSAERRALLLLLSLGLVGQGVRWLATRPGQPPGEVQLVQTLPPQSPIAHRDSILALSRPLGPDERIDADRAGAQELARLPRVGLALAKTIVADREAHGPFAVVGGLDRVPGIGPGLLSVIGPHLTFSGTARTPVTSSASLNGGALSQPTVPPRRSRRPRSTSTPLPPLSWCACPESGRRGPGTSLPTASGTGLSVGSRTWTGSRGLGQPQWRN